MDHNKYIAKKAKELLKPLGFKRQGKSRLWYKDNGWWAVVIEFQPSSWSKGTYVNVAVSDFLYEKPYWAYTEPKRIKGFASVDNDTDFESKFQVMAEEAAKVASGYMETYKNPGAWLKYHSREERRSIWDDYYSGVFSSFDGDYDSALKYFTGIERKKYSLLFEQGVQLRANELAYLLNDSELYKESIKGVVLRTRNMQNLEGFDVDNLVLPWK